MGSLKVLLQLSFPFLSSPFFICSWGGERETIAGCSTTPFSVTFEERIWSKELIIMFDVSGIIPSCGVWTFFVVERELFVVEIDQTA